VTGEEKMDGTCTHTYGGDEKWGQNLSENLRGRDYLEDLIIGKTVLKLILKKGVKVWIGFNWLRIRYSSTHL
jgi:hypothetical protein